jgi:hypothetical protein
MAETKITFGEQEGETCWRDGCQGVIANRPSENCSCHISPPCGSCTAAREYCPKCDWRACDEVEKFNDFVCKINPADRAGAWLSWKPRPLDPRKLDWRSKSHTHSSMIKEGVYPPDMTQAEVEKAVRGTFGGRFERFRDGEFKYIAYTD